MKTRVEALRRIARLQQQMQDLANWRLATLGRERAALAQSHREMIEAAGRGLASTGPLAVAATRRIRAVERQLDAAATDLAALATLAIDQAARAKLAARARSAADADHRAQRERKELSALIERSLSVAKASSA